MQHEFQLLSVIVPVYNVELYLPQCLDSIINQDYQNKEIILVDDGSTDQSGRICDDYASRYPYIKVIHKKNGGLSSARNVGLKTALAGGQASLSDGYISFIDSDDFILPGMYSSMIGELDSNDADMAVCSYQGVAYDNPQAHAVADVTSSVLTKENLYSRIFDVSLQVWNKIYKRNIIKDLTFEEGILYEDVEYSMKVFESINSAVFLPVDYYCYRLARPGSTVSSFKPSRVPAYRHVLELQKAVVEKYSANEYIPVSKLCSDFFIQQYYECRLLTNNRELLKRISNYYKHIVQYVPFSQLAIYSKLFYISPSCFYLLKKYRSNKK